MAKFNLSIPDFEVQEEIARGGFSILYRGTRNGKSYVVKVLKNRTVGEELGDANHVFYKEGATLARFHHPGVVKVMQVGKSFDQSFLIMEYVEGSTLTEVLFRRLPSETTILNWAITLAGALNEVHRHGLVHRDLKPDNIIIDNNLSAKLIDFGFIAEMETRNPSREVVGSFRYSPPEQTGMLNRIVDGRSDLYSLGAVLFECATGRPPFVTSDIAQLVREHATVIPPEAVTLNPNVSVAFSLIIEKLLAKDPDDRYQSAISLKEDLEQVDFITRAMAKGEVVRLGEGDSQLRQDSPLPLIGREAEMKLLRKAEGEASRKKGSFHLLTGEAGSGKSRLVKELLSARDKAKGRVFYAKCSQDNPMPFAALREATEAYCKAISQLNQEERNREYSHINEAAGDLAAVLRRFTPSLKSILAAAKDSASTEVGDQFGQILSDFFVRLAGNRLVVFCIEDLQWADKATLQVIRHLARVAHRNCLLLLATSRTDSDSQAVLNSLALDPKASSFHNSAIPALSDVHVEQLIRSLLGNHEVDPRLVAQITFRSRGNAFAISEYIRTLIDEELLEFSWGTWSVDPKALDSLALPSDVIQLVLKRLNRLSAPTLKALTTAAVQGSEIAAHDLKTILKSELHKVHLALNESFEAGLIEKTAFDTYAFVHDRVREALITRLSETEKNSLHQQIALSLDNSGSLTSPSRLYVIAHHYAQGTPTENLQRAYEANWEAGRLAAREYANHEAFDFLERANHFRECLGEKPNPNLLLLTGAVCFRVDQVDHGVAALQEALSAAKSSRVRCKIRVQLATGYLSRLNITLAKRELFEGFRELGKSFPTSALGQFFSTTYLMICAALAGLPLLYGKAKGKARRSHQLVVELYVVGGLILYHDFSDLLMLQFGLRGLYSARRLGPSREMAAIYARFACLLAILKMGRLASRVSKRSLGIAELISDKKALADASVFAGIASEFSGRPVEAENQLRHTLHTFARWMDHNQYLDAAFNTVTALRARGYMNECWERLQLALRRTEEAFNPEGSGFVLFPTYRAATLCTLGRVSEGAEAIRDVEKYTSSLADDRFIWAFYLTQKMIYSIETGDLEKDCDDICRSFRDRVRVSPRSVVYHVRYFYLYHCYARLELCMSSTGKNHTKRIKEFSKAIRELSFSGAMPMFKGHYLLLKANLSFLTGKLNKALRLIPKAEATAHEVDQPWVTFECQILRARILAKEGKESAAQRTATFAFQIAFESGWINRSRKIWQEFSLESREAASFATKRSVVSPVFSTKTASLKLKRQMDALMQVSMASASILDPIALARIALDEVIRIIGAERAYLFLHNERNGQLEMKAGRDLEGSDLDELRGFSSTVVRMAQTDCKPVVVTGTDEGPVLATQSILSNHLKSIAAVPLLLKEKFLGVIYLDSRLAKGAFTSDDIEVLIAIASQVAVSFETSQVAQLELERRQIKSAFQQYLSHEIVEKLLKDPKSLSLGSDRRELTVLFSDVRNFTTISEGLPPERLSELMNSYFGPMTAIILKSQGLLDKYIGDAMMAFWGAPLMLSDHASRAAQAALKMFDDLERVQLELTKKDFPKLVMGIGINTGIMSVGNMGSHERFNYTVLGDSVNLGSRLEKLTRYYGASILLSEYTHSQLKGSEGRCRDLDDVQVKGKTRPLRIFELLLNQVNFRNVDELIQTFNAGRDFYRNRDWGKAGSCFEACTKMKERDAPSLLYLERIKKFKLNPPDLSWNGITIFMRE